MLPQTREDFVTYCRRKIGEPVVQLNLDDDQVQDRVDEAVRLFQQYHYDGSLLWYTSYQIQAADFTNRYITMPEGTIGVTRIFTLSSAETNSAGQGGFNMFDINYQIRLNELYDYTAGDYVYFEIANQHLRMLEMLFTGEIPVRYNRYINRLYIDAAWEARFTTGQYIIAECYLDLDAVPGATPTYWGDPWLCQFGVALLKQQWYQNLSKYKSVTMPGGMILDAREMLEEANQEVERLKVSIREEYEMPPQWIVG